MGYIIQGTSHGKLVIAIFCTCMIVYLSRNIYYEIIYQKYNFLKSSFDLGPLLNSQKKVSNQAKYSSKKIMIMQHKIIKMMKKNMTSAMWINRKQDDVCVPVKRNAEIIQTIRSNITFARRNIPNNQIFLAF